jgi:hypothetical protein
MTGYLSVTLVTINDHYLAPLRHHHLLDGLTKQEVSFLGNSVKLPSEISIY